MTIQLSTVHPDVDSIRQQLELTLSSYEAWRDLLPIGTGRALTDWIAAVGANDQYAIEHAFRENFRTARLDSSILAQAILLGVRLSRKRPCSVEVTLSKVPSGTLTLPAFTQFSSTNGSLFNREAITLVDQTPVNVTLYEGVVRTVETNGDGSTYQLFVTRDDAFTVSEDDVKVEMNDVVLPRTLRGLWHLSNQQGYMDSTSPSGQLLLTFGGDGYGTTPQPSDTLRLTYAVTAGAAGSNANAIGDSVTCIDHREVSGFATSGLSGGGNEKGPTFYRKVGPQLFAAGDGATTKDQYSAVVASYPGVVDAIVLGQRDVAPADVRWMNMVQVSALTETTWDGPAWDAFVEWFSQRSIFPVRLYRRDPQPVVVNISAKVHCQGRADLNLVKATVEAQLTKLFTPRPGFIDSNVYLSDIDAAIRGSDSAIEFITIGSPTTDVLVHVAAPKTTLTAVAGTLPAGQYSYAVTAVTPEGETLATNFKSVVLNSAGGVQITWEPVPLATQYKVYGRTPLSMGQLAVTSGLTFTDSSLTTPTTGLPLINNGGHWYCKLGTLDIECLYTSRAFYNLGNLR